MKKLATVPYIAGKKAVGAIRKMGAKGAFNAASNVALGAGIVSVLPLSTTPSTDKDIDRMQQYQPTRRRDGRQQTAGGSRENR